MSLILCKRGVQHIAYANWPQILYSLGFFDLGDQDNRGTVFLAEQRYYSTLFRKKKRGIIPPEERTKRENTKQNKTKTLYANWAGQAALGGLRRAAGSYYCRRPKSPARRLYYCVRGVRLLGRRRHEPTFSSPLYLPVTHRGGRGATTSSPRNKEDLSPQERSPHPPIPLA